MGALTLKNFPFEIRGWEIQKFKSFDPTDSFLLPTTLYLNKNKIVQIEPAFNIYKSNWLTDKGRHYFDAMFKLNSKKQIYKLWSKFYSEIIIKVYIFEHCFKQMSQNYLVTIVFDFLSIELLGILSFISQNYSFITLKQIQSSSDAISDLESGFQLNKTKLVNSTLCLLVTTNPRYEGHVLNLNLRQRALKKKFKCILIGSLINLTFPVTFIGSDTGILKIITEGNHFICQNLKHSKNPFLFCNNELFKRNDTNTLKAIFKTFFYLNFFNKMWVGFNLLSSSISEVVTLISNPNRILKLKDLYNFSCLYFLNVSANKIAHFKKIIELYLLKQPNSFKIQNSFLKKKIILDQNYQKHNNLKISSKITTNYLYVPTNTFYFNKETYINTEGFIKRTIPVIAQNKTKSNWQILRKFLKCFKNEFFFFNNKDNEIVYFNFDKLYNFKNFISFQYYPVKKITTLSCYLNIKNKVFFMNRTAFKKKSSKFNNTKLKYWLDDFFATSNDPYSKNSNVLLNCSTSIKFQKTNFF